MSQELTDIVDLANRMAILEIKLGEVIEALGNKKNTGVAPTVERMKLKPVADEVLFPPSYRHEVDEILGKDFGAWLTLGDEFAVVVPLEKSNADKGYLAVHKRDVRLCSLRNQGLIRVKEWCTIVRKNLEKSGVRFPVNTYV